MSKQFCKVYRVVEREGKKPWWVEIGVAFPNESGYTTVRLHALPPDGELTIAPPEAPKEKEEGEEPQRAWSKT